MGYRWPEWCQRRGSWPAPCPNPNEHRSLISGTGAAIGNESSGVRCGARRPSPGTDHLHRHPAVPAQSREQTSRDVFGTEELHWAAKLSVEIPWSQSSGLRRASRTGSWCRIDIRNTPKRHGRTGGMLFPSIGVEIGNSQRSSVV